MAKEKRNLAMVDGGGGAVDCCKVEAVVTVDDRGQIVLPKDIRDRAGIRPGDKLALVGFEDRGGLCCVSLVKVEELTQMVRTRLGPIMREVFEDAS
ncbi:MAG: Bifunctional DNA-binding transcriptional regulator of stationary/sporulation/toxin gene expression and antitoxin component of the YhaV-PrlF toxin-antitoxin module [Chloroflexi bacterium]|jgi:AbrB family looped-hinge helix DNA binding protein|nr:MAG: Bifunctional DNA-binding transcriptional regulator of stationary/sporulation/toxin gene expression and antitoxin component of the YhaV-PrlF toxin-antitoxin module [Chloroflexota bacterium]